MSSWSIQCSRNRNRSVDAPAPFLEALENDRLAADIDPARGEREGFRDPATRIVQHGAQRPYGPVGLRGGVKEGVAFGGCEVKASAFGIVELDGFAHNGTVCITSVPKSTRTRHGNMQKSCPLQTYLL